MNNLEHETTVPASPIAAGEDQRDISPMSAGLLQGLQLVLDNASPFSGKSHQLNLQLQRLRQATNTATVSVLCDGQFLPIEAFKFQPINCLPQGTSEGMTCFRSSGTSSKDRSQSYFSRLGLHFYEQQAWRSFEAVLKQFFPKPEQIAAYRLVPTTNDWPDSSLAHMLDSFSSYLNIEFDPTGEKIKACREPIWVFGTAFHFVNLYDQGFRAALPAGSVIFETGGTKNQSRHLSRQELYQAIGDMFSVSTNYIVSEYGMSELACQAYDFVSNPSGPEQSLRDRSYRFPRWVSLNLQTSEGQKEAGFGALIVDDPLRIDAPWPIRTQDLVNLQADGRFQLVGRVPAASLKGCSLRVEELTHRPPSVTKTEQAEICWQDFAVDEIRQRCVTLYNPIRQIFSSAECHSLLTEYFQSELIASWAQEDLLFSLPASAEDLFAAACQASKAQAVPERWLIIGPASHPIAVLHPIGLAAALGIKIQVRSTGKDFAFLTWLCQKLQDLDVDIKLLPESFRLTGYYPNADAIMIFGSNETVEKIQTLSSQFIQGFGSHTSASITMASELRKQGAGIIKDSFSLKQEGCRSSRLLFVIQDRADFDMQQELQFMSKAWSSYQAREDEKIALLQEKARLNLLNINFFPHQDEVPVLFPLHRHDEKYSVETYLSFCPFVLPIILVKEEAFTGFTDWLLHDASIKSLSLSPKVATRIPASQIETCPLGRSNILSWNGKHDGKELFHIDRA